MQVDPHPPHSWSTYDPRRASDAAVHLYDYWMSKRRDQDDLPSRDDIRPEEIKPLLPYLWIMDFDRPTRTFRYRLIGTAVVEGVGEDYTGRTLAECQPDEGAYDTATRALLRLADDAVPLWRIGTPMFHHHAEVLRLENLILALAADRRRPDRILGLTLFYDSGGRLYRPGVIRAT
ncbi:PAS domain-containing protein [Thalassobaculum sp.]|uniref:PAS domain-containing protein n=1 Tax=Thalassobaculum sp. TaxID=2022740 RepID=UPI0032EBB9DC